MAVSVRVGFTVSVVVGVEVKVGEDVAVEVLVAGIVGLEVKVFVAVFVNVTGLVGLSVGVIVSVQGLQKVGVFVAVSVRTWQRPMEQIPNSMDAKPNKNRNLFIRAIPLPVSFRVAYFGRTFRTPDIFLFPRSSTTV